MNVAVPADIRHASKSERRQALESPYLADHEASISRVAESRRMPRDFHGLLAWLAQAMALELVEKIHPARSSVWSEHLRRFRVTERGDILCVACGKRIVDEIRNPDTDARAHAHPGLAAGSLLGSPDELGAWRMLMYGSATATDEDGYYLAPVHRALGELEREGRGDMVIVLFAVVASGYDWRGVAERGIRLSKITALRMSEAVMRDYLTFALMRLWHLTIARDDRRMRD